MALVMTASGLRLSIAPVAATCVTKRSYGVTCPLTVCDERATSYCRPSQTTLFATPFARRTPPVCASSEPPDETLWAITLENGDVRSACDQTIRKPSPLDATTGRVSWGVFDT